MILISQHERKKGSDFTFGAVLFTFSYPIEASLELIKKRGEIPEFTQAVWKIRVSAIKVICYVVIGINLLCM